MNIYGVLPLFFNFLFNVLLLIYINKFENLSENTKSFLKGLDGCWLGFSLFLYFIAYVFSLWYLV